MIGIFGGSFNPVHRGHVALAEQLLQKKGLEAVWLMVSPQNPLKPAEGLMPDSLRLEMLKAAVEGHPGLVASDYEFHLPKPSYTWHTLDRLSSDFPDKRFVLLIGGDNWEHFDRWYRHDDILARWPVIVYPRPGTILPEGELPEGVSVVDAELMDISSTEIRRRLKTGEPIGQLVVPAVERILRSRDKSQNLYPCP